MEKKSSRIIVLLISAICLCGGIWVLVRDIAFFVTKEESEATVLAVTPKSSGYAVQLSYFNSYKGREITTTVKLKRSYKNKLDNLNGSVVIYYSKLFPKQVYIAGFNVIKKGIIIFEIIFITLLLMAFKFGLEGLKKSSKKEEG